MKLTFCSLSNDFHRPSGAHCCWFNSASNLIFLIGPKCWRLLLGCDVNLCQLLSGPYLQKGGVWASPGILGCSKRADCHENAKKVLARAECKINDNRKPNQSNTSTSEQGAFANKAVLTWNPKEHRRLVLTKSYSLQKELCRFLICACSQMLTW